MNDPFELKSVAKTYGPSIALDGVQLAGQRGRVIGLIGRNGSGKTTLIRMLAGLVLPTRGTCHVLGVDNAVLGAGELSRLGVVHQEGRLAGWMRVGQHLEYVASFYSSWDRELERRLLQDLELDPREQVGKLSPGNRQKLALILALGHRPELLLLDEPASALDPLAREVLLAAVLELLQDQARTVVISSHVLRDVERVIDWVVCLDRGRVIVDDALDHLQERFW